jgi:hypothetical protein
VLCYAQGQLYLYVYLSKRFRTFTLTKSFRACLINYSLIISSFIDDLPNVLIIFVKWEDDCEGWIGLFSSHLTTLYNSKVEILSSDRIILKYVFKRTWNEAAVANFKNYSCMVVEGMIKTASLLVSIPISESRTEPGAPEHERSRCPRQETVALCQLESLQHSNRPQWSFVGVFFFLLFINYRPVSLLLLLYNWSVHRLFYPVFLPSTSLLSESYTYSISSIMPIWSEELFLCSSAFCAFFE